MLDVGRLRVLAAVARHGSVTRAAKELHYSQPSVSHHLARLEAETGAQLLQRVGRGVRLTEAGRVLAERATEILGRLDSAAAELSAHVGLSTGRVRLAAFASALGTFVPKAAELLADEHPGLRLELTEAHPPEALQMLRAGHIDLAVIFRYDTTSDDEGIRLTHLVDDSNYLLTSGPPATLIEHRESRWIGGCDRCRSHLVRMCAEEGFEPAIAFTTDDIAAVQALVAAGMGVTVIPGMALRAHRHPEVNATEIPGSVRHVSAAVYGDPPDPPATTALLSALSRSA